ncbi:hypothetical protein CP985_06535 [Malaciobacter mytili LMG 24559]|uniref:Diguanylate cyclase/phosphodiesterase n=1 Tax=Malaciobacter mytili LMG 24559 TaxID=1032238 RepID=A0AAX2AI26_9BACT|nr:EAL domain-containing protein [Malaciobacter mytili]AXH15383.1 diguanylate cyclase/phosphodiesterase [Malaciobacter mytili LMG 24559]RXK15829.1 hypothetical protein CP985_06535 [Malaciobacter mytili LMG 24559]
MKKVFFFKNSLFLIFFVVVASFILLFLLYGTVKLENTIQKKMVEISTTDVISIIKNSAETINRQLDKTKSYNVQIKENEALQKDIEEKLEALITQNIKYVYLLYKDERGVFRFLVDGAKSENKAFINQKFDIDNEKWLSIYTTKKPTLIKNKYLKQLSITYLVPILNNDNVELVFAVDFSVEKLDEINKIITLMKNGIIGIISILILFLIVLIIQAIKYLSVKRSAYIDRLTNVYNRNYLHELETFINLDQYIIGAIDIDHFKVINDTYGHDIGDKVLRQISHIILSSIRAKEDIVIRYGGEEFLILAKVKREDRFIALNVIERIFTNIQKSKIHISKKDVLEVSVSIGVNLEPNKSRTFSQAFKLADIALYNAKNKGRNNIQIYDETNKRFDDNNGLLSINEIKEAIEEKRVICYYQKIVNDEEEKYTQYEALLRIVDKNGNIVTPDKILPVIKGTFLLRNISKRVLKICFEKLLEEPNIMINVNLNPQDIVNDSVLDILKRFASKPNISNRLGIEISESEDLINCKDSKENILLLKQLGYKIYIDDFGSGYSNFIYLAEVNSDFIKIDGTIIKKILDDKIAFLLVKSIVQFAKEANIEVIAEYVCNKEIYEKVKSLGIKYSQGFYFSIPKEFDKKS